MISPQHISKIREVLPALDKLEEVISETLFEERTDMTFVQKEELRWIRHQARGLRDKIREEL